MLIMAKLLQKLKSQIRRRSKQLNRKRPLGGNDKNDKEGACDELRQSHCS